MMKIIAFLKKKAVYIPLGAVILLGGAIAIYSATRQPEYETGKAVRRTFVDEISVTGKVVAANDVELGFESGGRVTSIPATVGMKVTKGKALAYVNSADLYASLLDQQARLLSARVQLAEVERGTRPTELVNINDAFKVATTDLENEIRDSYANADDVLRTDIDLLFNDATGPYPHMINSVNDWHHTRLEDRRVEIGDLIEDWGRSMKRFEVEGYSDTYRVEAETNLKAMREFLTDLATATSYLEESRDVTAAENQTYISAISSGRATINAAIASLNASYQAYLSAEGDLTLSEEGSTPEQIQRAQAAVQSAEANVLQAQAALARTSIFAPFDGVVTKVDLRVGQQVTSGSPVIGVISNANFEIESYVAEADIAKVRVGDVGTTTLDAYGDDVVFSVVVTTIDLSDTEVDGVSTYKTILQFSTSDERIRSGMTANIDLVSKVRERVLSIPQSAITNKDGKRTVLVRDENGKEETKEVKTGSYDNDGNVEIVDGINEGDTILWLSSK